MTSLLKNSSRWQLVRGIIGGACVTFNLPDYQDPPNPSETFFQSGDRLLEYSSVGFVPSLFLEFLHRPPLRSLRPLRRWNVRGFRPPGVVERSTRSLRRKRGL